VRIVISVDSSADVLQVLVAAAAQAIFVVRLALVAQRPVAEAAMDISLTRVAEQITEPFAISPPPKLSRRPLVFVPMPTPI
jgi:hypothetical protein